MLSGTILHNELIAPSVYRMGVSVTGPFTAAPGQFVMLRCSSTLDPLLSRPFSIMAISGTKGGKVFEILYKVTGKGTKLISGLEKNEQIHFSGPFGKGFMIRENREYWLIAGGIGIPPIYFLAEHLKNLGVDSQTVKIFFGARGTKELYCLDDLEKLGYPLVITTDDHSYGGPGLVTDPLINMLDEYVKGTKPMPVVYACGPGGLLQVLVQIVELYNIEIQVSMETRMGCGLGICQGCVVKLRTHNGFNYVKSCVDGPVFDARDIIWV